jgi:preprotein translocase subunit SecA
MEVVREEIVASIKACFDAKIEELTHVTARDLLRYVVLNTLDDAWRDHLLAMDELRRGIGLRSIGQKDPLVEYQFESYNLFQGMMLRVRESFTEQFFRVRVISERATRRERKMSEIRDFHLPTMKMAVQALGEGRPEPFRKNVKIGRNDPCHCGSGKKYKYCCGKSE